MQYKIFLLIDQKMKASFNSISETFFRLCANKKSEMTEKGQSFEKNCNE